MQILYFICIMFMYWTFFNNEFIIIIYNRRKNELISLSYMNMHIQDRWLSWLALGSYVSASLE
jgi:hypothetical protein